MKTQTKKLEKIILKLLSDEFDVVRIVSVDVREDADDQTILLIDVVFEGKAKVDARKLTGIVRKVRPALLREAETRFPVFSFIAKSEAGHSAREVSRAH